MSWLSQRLGKNHAYIQQYVDRGSPRELDLEMKIKIAEALAMPLHELGVTEYDIRQRSNSSDPKGVLEEDATAYVPPPGSILTAHPTIGYMKMTSNVLESHPLRIVAGDVLAFNMSPAAVESVRSEQIVLLQLYDKSDMLKARTAIREYIRPGLCVTNRTTDNEIFALGDPGLPFEPVIKGVFQNLVRG